MEFQKRWTFFYSSGLVAGAFGGVNKYLPSKFAVDVLTGF